MMGPFQELTVEDDGTFSYLDSERSFDGRVFPNWKVVGGNGGYGSINPSEGNFNPAPNEPCRERMSPLTFNTFDSPAFNSPCQRTGNRGQIWDETAELCDGSLQGSMDQL